jgi:hypothetical protein
MVKRLTKASVIDNGLSLLVSIFAVANSLDSYLAGIVVHAIDHAIIADSNPVRVECARQFATSFWSRLVSERIDRGSDPRYSLAVNLLQIAFN